MAKRQSASSVRARRVARNARLTRDRDLDFSDIPEATSAELKRARRVGRPRSEAAKQLIAIRIDPRLLASLRRMATRLGKPYQTLIHELLEKAAGHAA